MTTNPLRILMATDVPFWNAATGAEQRIHSLARFFCRPPFHFKTFFVGQVGPEDHLRITDGNWDVTFFEHAKPPEEFLARVKWYVDAARHQIQRWMNRGKHDSESEARDPGQPLTPLTLADYRWPWAMDQFRNLCQHYRPQVFLSEYVTMAYLLDALPNPDQVHCVLDTHDILHERGLQFGAAGYLHWLEIDQAEEAAVWERFHTILAIQPHEAEVIKSLTRRPTVLCVGHAPAARSSNLDLPSAADADDHDGLLRVGYIGSANYSNWHAINRFLIEVWPEVISLDHLEAELVIAGKICDWFALRSPSGSRAEAFEKVLFLGEVPTLEDFYRRVDIVVNPVQFGTGLKIKNVEALAFGKPLITTEVGAEGLSEAQLSSCLVVPHLREMADQLVDLCQNPSKRAELGQKSLLAAKQTLSESVVYSELAEHLQNSAKRGFQISPSQ